MYSGKRWKMNIYQIDPNKASSKFGPTVHICALLQAWNGNALSAFCFLVHATDIAGAAFVWLQLESVHHGCSWLDLLEFCYPAASLDANQLISLSCKVQRSLCADSNHLFRGDGQSSASLLGSWRSWRAGCFDHEMKWHMGGSWDRGIHKSTTLMGFSWIFHYKHSKPYVWGYLHLWKPPYSDTWTPAKLR